MRYSSLLIIFLLIFLVSCNLENQKTETEYYKSLNIIKIKRKYSSKSKLDYDYISYYESGSVESKGRFLNSKKEGKWEFWFSNGTKETDIIYKHGKVDFANKNRMIPQLLLDNDSLRIGTQTLFKVINMYPAESFRMSNNVIFEFSDSSRTITPISGDSMYFYFRIPEEMRLNEACKKTLLNFGLSENEIEDASCYKTYEVISQVLPIYK